jgi:predicted transposase/invertase (TIGR01784 family)
LQNLEPKQTELLINWFVKILMGKIGREHIDEIKKIIQESREVDTMVSNIELLIEKEMKRNREEGEKMGEKRGIAKGREEGIREAAKNLLIAGVDMEIISKSTGLSEDELKKIKEDMN